MRAKTNASGNQRSVQSEIARPSRIAAGSRGRFTADGSTMYLPRLAAKRAMRSAAGPVASERVQRAERVLVSARDPGVPPRHVPEVLQAGGVPACAEPQQRRAGVGQLTRQGPAHPRFEPRIAGLVNPVVGANPPMRGAVVARLGPRAPAPS